LRRRVSRRMVTDPALAAILRDACLRWSEDKLLRMRSEFVAESYRGT
jgi:hypothetical protein